MCRVVMTSMQLIFSIVLYHLYTHRKVHNKTIINLSVQVLCFRLNTLYRSPFLVHHKLDTFQHIWNHMVWLLQIWVNDKVSVIVTEVSMSLWGEEISVLAKNACTHKDGSALFGVDFLPITAVNFFGFDQNLMGHIADQNFLIPIHTSHLTVQHGGHCDGSSRILLIFLTDVFPITLGQTQFHLFADWQSQWFRSLLLALDGEPLQIAVVEISSVNVCFWVVSDDEK